MLQYGVGLEDVSVGDIFKRMEEIEKDLEIEDYSVSQNTLDNVNISFPMSLERIFKSETLCHVICIIIVLKDNERNRPNVKSISMNKK